MGLFFSIIRSVTNITSSICILMLVATVIIAIKERRVSDALQELGEFIKSEIHVVRVLALMLVSISIFSTPILNPGVQQIIDFNNIYLKSEGDYCYYIEINGNLYPAIISITSEDEEYGYYDEKTRTKYHYNLSKAVLWDDRVHEFDWNKPLIVGESVSVYDIESGDDYGCILHNKHAYSDLLEEDNDITAFNFVILGIQMASYALVLYVLTKWDSQSHDKHNATSNG